MPIPDLDEDGFLAPGIYDCTLEEVRERFGRFRSGDRRQDIFRALETYVQEIAAAGLASELIVDGSFTTGEDTPHDVDVVAILPGDYNLRTPLPPFKYNL